METPATRLPSQNYCAFAASSALAALSRLNPPDTIMRPAQLLAAALTLSSLSAAWPWPPNMDDIKGVIGIENILYRRQNNNNNDKSCKFGPSTLLPSLVLHVPFSWTLHALHLHMAKSK